MKSQDHINRPMTLKISLHDNPALRAVIAQYKAREYLARQKGGK